MPRKVLYNICMGCGGCVGVCPFLALNLDKGYEIVVDTEMCTDCGTCTKFCPVGAIVEV